MNQLHPRLARRQAELRGELVPTAEDNLRIAAENQAHDRQSIAAAPDPVLTAWAQVAESVDESTWQRILADLSPDTRAECERLRPPQQLPEVAARQADALNRLARQKPAYRRKEQP